jgi:hypothetical protein
MTENNGGPSATVLVQIGEQTYEVVRDPSIGAGEIRVGSFGALDALMRLAPAPAAPLLVRTADTDLPTPHFLRLRRHEKERARTWLQQNGHTLTATERLVMAATFPPSGGFAPSAKAALTANMGPETLRRIRSDVLRRAGVLQR